ncbi:MAG: DUF4160 domain-containing protein [Sphingomonas sp.]|uniref:DUF4160 domain-containing protein n=1 Tax=Sphingomonas sp. TaxID=28214 RepID=UPI0025DD8F3B|nr:DUF4160 domain-containing protein [Sphingomonas sp.]MBY0282653.1 DUF4160 domain-containing protein [Sphingomonas sp.]
MPVVFRERGFRFHFFSKEGKPLEPVHIHVARPGGDAKLWLYPEVRVAYNRRLNPRELREVEQIVTERRQEIEDAWNAFFTGSNQRGIR